MEASRPKGNVSTRGGSPSRLAGAAANGKTTPVRAKSPPATTLDPLPTTPNGKANNNNKQRKSSGEPGKCELHDIADCEWCALGVKNRAMYGRLWPYAEHPVTREHYCLEPVESPTGGKYPCCSFRREKPIKTSQGYAGHLASHRAHIQGSTNTINGVGVAPLPLLVAMSNGGGSGGGGSAAASPSSNGDQALGKKRKRESTLTGSHETVATPTMPTTVSTTSSSGGGSGKVMPQFVASLQPSLPRCDLEAGQLRFILLPQDSEAAAIDVVFKGHRGKLSKSAAKDADGFFVIACPLIHELLPPNDTRTTFEVSVRVEDPATHRRLFQSSLLFTHHHAAAQASAAPRAESVVAGGSAPRPPARAIANGEGDYDEAEEGEEEEKEEEKEEEMMTNKEEDDGDGERAGEEETKNEDEKTKTKKEKRRKIEEEKSGGEEMPEEKKEEKMEIAGVEGEEAEEASESQAMELEIAEENEDDDDEEEENDAEANVKKNEGEADGEDQKERRRSEVIGEAGDNGKNDATQQSPELRPDVTVKIEAMGETIADEKVDHQLKPQRELPDMLTQLAEAAAAESHSNVAPVAGRPAPSPGKANGHGHGAAVERPTMAEALHAMPMNTVSSLLPWAHMAAAAAGGHPLPPHFALPDCYALTPAAAAAAAAAIAADPHTAALMLPGLFQSYYGPGGPLPLSALLPPMPHASHLPLPPPTTRPLAPMPASMMTSASPSSSAMSTSSSASAISPALTSMIKAKAPSSPPTSSTTTTTTSGGAPATATPPRSSVSPPPTTPTTTSTATTAMLAQKPWLRGQLAPMAQMMTSIPPPKPPKPAKPAKPVKPPKVVKPVVKPAPPPPFVLQPAGSGPTTPPTAAAAGTAASTSASSAPSPTVAASRPLQTLLAAAARPSGAAAGGREACRYYFYTVLPEKGKLIWVVFFSSRRHALDQYELLLHEVAPPLSASSGSLSSSIERLACSNGGGGGGLSLSLSSSASALALAMATELEPDAGDSPSPPTASTPQPPPLSPPLPELPTSGGPGQQTIVLPAVPDLAWIAEGTDASTGQRLYQHKVCFQAPDSTFERRIFCATLHQRVERTMTLLGGLSLVSTTSQREQMWSRINQWFVSEVQQRLVHNCRHHPPSRRHFLNGKGSRQGSKQAQKDRFLFDELDKSVELESVPVNSLLPPGS